MFSVDFNGFKPDRRKDDVVLDLSPLVGDRGMECELPEEDFLQQLSSDLEIPMLLEESLHSDREMDSLFEASSFFKEFDDGDWAMDPVFLKAPDSQSQVCQIKEEEIKVEPDILPMSPSSLSHDSWSSTDTKNILETPPYSPPQSSNGSPPRTPTPPSHPVIMVGGKPIKIVPMKHNTTLNVDGKTKVVLPKKLPSNMILQPKPINVTSIGLNNGSNGQKTLVLAPNDFNSLTNQMVINKTGTAPTKIRIVHPLNHATATIKTEPLVEKQDTVQMKALKRQQRMIKNRESACLSRKKKKEYITSLESRISDLEKENNQLKVENEALKERLCQYEPSTTKRPKTVFNVNVKKTAILAVLFVVSLNLGSLSLLSRGLRSEAVMSVPNLPLAKHSGRRLLWTDTDLQNISTSSQQPTCPLHINQTESLRLNSELRRWIGEKPLYKNASNKNKENLLLYRDSEDLNNDLMPYEPYTEQIPVRTYPAKLRRKVKIARKEDQELAQVVGPHAGLLEALHRRDDTFYVVSFSGDHLLLPALAHNTSVRPKMSLVLPALPLNATVETGGASVTMMQIDCEVLDTRLVELNEKVIPAHLRQAKASPPTPHTPHNVSNQEEPVRSSYRRNLMRTNRIVDPYSMLQRGPQDLR